MYKLVTCAIFCLTLAANSAIYYVHEGESIQSAVAQTNAEDTVLVEDGAYPETVLIFDRSLTLASRVLLDGDTNHIGNCVLQPDFSRPDTASCIFVNSLPTDSNRVRIVGFSLRDGQGSWVEYVAGYFGNAGGAVLAQNTNTIVEQCVVRAATGGIGVGICFLNNASFPRKHNSLSSVEISGCESNLNSATLYAQQSELNLHNCSFVGNSCPSVGDVISADRCSLRVAECRIDSNVRSTAFGLSQCWVDIAESHVGWNTSHPFGPTDIHAAYCHGRIHHCVFEENATPTLVFEFLNIDQRSPFFESNIVRHCNGTSVSGIILLANSRTEIVHNLFESNRTGGGAVIDIIGSQNTRNVIRHNLFYNNSVDTTLYGSVLFDQTFEGTIIDSNWVAGNAAPVVTSAGNAHRQFDCRYNWWGHASGPYHAELNPTGQGDTLVGDDCDFIPWLTEPPDTSGWLPAISHERIPIAKSWQISAIYPNPFNSSVTISLEGATGSDFELSLHNLLGQKVDTIRQGAVRGETIHYSAPPNLSSGVYFVVARDRQALDTRKLVLLR